MVIFRWFCIGIRIWLWLMTLADYYFIMHLMLQAQHKYDLLNKQVNELSADVEKQLASQSYSQKKITHQVWCPT